MAVIKCSHCGELISSTLDYCTECGKPLVPLVEKGVGDVEPSADAEVEADEQHTDTPAPAQSEPQETSDKPKNTGTRRFRISARRIIVILVLAPFVIAAICLLFADIKRAGQLEQRAYERLENCTNLLVYEDFMVRFPDSKYMDEVKERYQQMKQEQAIFFHEAAKGGRAELLAFIEKHPTSPYCSICELRLDSLDWEDACELNTLDAFTAYLAKHPQGVFVGDATDARNRQLRLVVTPEEQSILRGAVDNFLSAMTSKDADRIDAMTGGAITFCGTPESTGSHIVEYYLQNIHKDDVLGVHFQLGGTSINKRNVSGSEAMNYNLYSTAIATINRSSLDSTMTVNYKISASFSPERRLTSVSMSPIVEVAAE